MQHLYYFPSLNRRFYEKRHSTLAIIQLPASHIISGIKPQHARNPLNLTISITQETRKT